VSRFRVLRPQVYWSSCPSSEELRVLRDQGLSLVVDLTENECSYDVPQGVERLVFPIPDFSFRSPEVVFYKVVEPAKREVEGGGTVLVHCMGGIGRSGTVAAMLLVILDRMTLDGALSRVRRLGGGPQVPAQATALRWFERNVSTIGYSKYLSFSERITTLGERKADHISSRINLALDILSELGLSDLQPEQFFECMIGALSAGTQTACLQSSLGEAAGDVLRLVEMVGNVFNGEGLYVGLEKRDGKLYLLLNGFAAAGELASRLRSFIRESRFLRDLMDVEEVFE